MGEHYFSVEPSAPSQPVSVELRLPDMKLSLRADRGVFSGTRVDPGTMALLKESPAPPEIGDLLDLGCGYGPIACVLARRSPAARVWAVDINARALELTSANAAANGLANVVPVRPEDVPANVMFSGVWSNPPVRVGKQVLHDLLNTWLARLVPAASAWLVMNRHLGADSLTGWLEGRGWDVRRIASKSGYRVLEVNLRSKNGPGREEVGSQEVGSQEVGSQEVGSQEVGPGEAGRQEVGREDVKAMRNTGP